MSTLHIQMFYENTYVQITIGEDSKLAYSSQRILSATSASHYMGCHLIIHVPLQGHNKPQTFANILMF